MPWKAVGKNIVRADTGKVVGHSKDHATAEASVRARYANTKGENFATLGVKSSTKGKK